jgi:hypothetical protein
MITSIRRQTFRHRVVDKYKEITLQNIHDILLVSFCKKLILLRLQRHFKQKSLDAASEKSTYLRHSDVFVT